MKQKNPGFEKALQKIRHYCVYQERSHTEVKEKLYSLGLYKNEVETMLSQLVEENYLNEERYAIAFAGGKFRIKHWGRIKIKYELNKNNISSYCIKKALDSIDKNQYNKTLKTLFELKLKTVKTEKNTFTRNKKIFSYLLQKGFETELISELLQNHNNISM